jgi:hypothetical protein
VADCAADARSTLPQIAILIQSVFVVAIHNELAANVDVLRLRGGRQGWAATPAPPAQGAAPGNPDSMHSLAKRLARMLTGNGEQYTMIQVLA